MERWPHTPSGWFFSQPLIFSHHRFFFFPHTLPPHSRFFVAHHPCATPYHTTSCVSCDFFYSKCHAHLSCLTKNWCPHELCLEARVSLSFHRSASSHLAPIPSTIISPVHIFHHHIAPCLLPVTLSHKWRWRHQLGFGGQSLPSSGAFGQITSAGSSQTHFQAPISGGPRT